jgi:hypothetical protein
MTTCILVLAILLLSIGCADAQTPSPEGPGATQPAPRALKQMLRSQLEQCELEVRAKERDAQEQEVLRCDSAWPRTCFEIYRNRTPHLKNFNRQRELVRCMSRAQ